MSKTGIYLHVFYQGFAHCRPFGQHFIFNRRESALIRFVIIGASRTLFAITENFDVRMPDTIASTLAERSPLMSLPSELRRIIFTYALEHKSKFHITNSIQRAMLYKKLETPQLEGLIPLLIVNRQTFMDCADIIRRTVSSTIVTVYSQGFSLDSLTLSKFLISRLNNTKPELHNFIVEIYPPRSERPIDMLHTWLHLRKLRDRLAKMASIENLHLRFADHDVFRKTWDRNREATSILPSMNTRKLERSSGERYSDVEVMLNLFQNMTNVQDVEILLPKSLTSSKIGVWLVHCVDITRYIMMREKKPLGRLTLVDCLDYEMEDKKLKYETARMVYNKIEETVGKRGSKMPETEYDELCERDCYLELLGRRLGSPLFPGKWHYVTRPG